MNHEEWKTNIPKRYEEAVARGEHDTDCEYHPEGFYLCHCRKRARIAQGFVEPPSGELYFPPPSCLRCHGDLDYDEGWTCHECRLHWSAAGTDAEYQDDHGDDLAAESARWAERWLTTQPSERESV
ncbi:hypothetical protein HR12_21025 [Microbacterium sp. SUBG005]|nr:hypothetical protein HR12_21025 [Microbacterium sp. SUBG005]